ncbi:hypothetical protein MRB53_022681 [Persea americana]|uniref:Uncharacterized protein n=1 Tax=Persea americana TaxID=3435 RepID=A0ACC2L8A1_PERAE|nr:hypothetical protein MRB53_022681 [Persea americana]
MPCLAASGAGTADVASARDTVVAAMLEVAAESYTEEPEHVAVAAEETLKVRSLNKKSLLSIGKEENGNYLPFSLPKIYVL